MKENKITKTIDFIKGIIENTIWENHVFVVGGCVRDIAMDAEPKDLDLVVDKECGGVAFASWLANHTQCYELGKNPVIFPKFGTAKMNIRTQKNIKDVDIECVQTRKEHYHSESRNPQVTFGTINEDAQRRDLTINSLYLNISTGELLDPNGKGLEDIQNEIIRTPSDANKIFEEDPLRQLRVIRFATRFGWGIEKNTWLGIVTNAYRMNIISQERITEELNKILLCDRPSKGIRALYNCGLLEYVLPEVKALRGITQSDYHFGDVFDHTMEVLDQTKPILENRLGALFHDIAKPRTFAFYNSVAHFYQHEDIGATMTEEIMKRMKYPNETIKCVTTIVKNHMRFRQFKEKSVPSSRTLRRFHATVGEYLDNVLDVIDADNKSHAAMFCMPKQIPLISDKIKDLEKRGESSSKIKLPINGKDIMEALKIKSSPLIGQYLIKVKEAILDNPKLTKEECLKIVKDIVYVD